MSYQLLKIAKEGDWDGLSNALDECYEPRFVVEQLKRGLDRRCKRVLLERNYNDKDYRSTYYRYYATKGHRYEAACVRLHFFDERVELRDGFELFFRVLGPGEVPNDAYLGFMVLRPTRVNTIGRTVLAPAAISEFHGCLISADHKVHVLGHRLSVRGFPYMSQHVDISVCAHASCWGILRHYSERFPEYAEFLTYDITRMAHEFDPGGLVPSAGLRVGDAERVFASAGTFPVVVPRDQGNPGLFWRQLFAYVESGFPLFAELGRIGHAVSVVGHTCFGEVRSGLAVCRFACDAVKGLVVVDDNFLPYRVISRRGASSRDYGYEDISTFIVALPDKIYYSAKQADSLAIELATEERFGFNHAALGELVLRYFLTTASHLRSFMHEQRSAFEPDFMAAVMQLALPQFVWVIEIASLAQWTSGTITTRAVVDATAGPAEALPIFLMHDARRAFVWDRGGTGNRRDIPQTASGSAPLNRMTGNLSIH